MPERVHLPGSAALQLADGVAYLDPATAVFAAMLDGWAAQQRTRFLKADTIEGRAALVRRFQAPPVSRSLLIMV